LLVDSLAFPLLLTKRHKNPIVPESKIGTGESRSNSFESFSLEMKRGEKEEKSRVRLGGFFPNRPFCPAFTSSPLLLRFSYILVLPVCPIPFPTSPHIPSFFFSFIHSLKPRGCHEVRFFLNFFSSLLLTFVLEDLRSF